MVTKVSKKYFCTVAVLNLQTVFAIHFTKQTRNFRLDHIKHFGLVKSPFCTYLTAE
jgi:hypothetical protein